MLTGDTAPRSAPAALAVEEKLEHVAAGRGVVVLPQSAANFYRRTDIASIVLTDIGPSRVGLAWDATRRSRLINEFADLAATTR